MSISDWSDSLLLAELSNEPSLSEDLKAIIARLEAEGAAAPNVVLNFSEVHYICSTNISQLLRIRKLCIEHRRRLGICSVSDQVWGVVLVTGLDKVFSFHENVALALASIQVA